MKLTLLGGLTNTGLRAKTEQQPCLMMTKPVGVAQMGGMAETEKWPSVAVGKRCGCRAWGSGQEREGAKRDVGRASGMPEKGEPPSVTLSERGGRGQDAGGPKLAGGAVAAASSASPPSSPPPPRHAPYYPPTTTHSTPLRLPSPLLAL